MPLSRRRQLSPEAELTLAAISTRERQAVNRKSMADLAARVQVDDLVCYVHGQRVGLVVAPRLNECGFAELAGAIDDKLHNCYQRAQAEAGVQAVLTHGLLDRLHQRHIPAVALKGVLLSELLYGDPAIRQSRDIDILVEPHRLAETVAIAQEEFLYAPPVDAVGPDGRPLLHYSLPHPAGGPGLEVHWRVHWYEHSSGTAMLRRSVESDGLCRMQLADELACLLLFYARDGFVGVRDLAALTAWWDRFGNELPPSGLGAVAAEFPQLAPSLVTSARVAEGLAGLPAGRLGLGAAPPSRRERRAAQLADPEPRHEPAKLQADIALADLLLAPGLDLRSFARRQMLLDASYVNALRPGKDCAHGDRRLRVERLAWRAARIATELAVGAPRVHRADWHQVASRSETADFVR
jgi:hypothetical protein